MLGWPLAHGFPSSRPSRVCRSICRRERAVPLRTSHAHCTILNDGSATPWRNSEFLWPGFSGRVLDLVPGFNQPDYLIEQHLEAELKFSAVFDNFVSDCKKYIQVLLICYSVAKLILRNLRCKQRCCKKILAGSYAIPTDSYGRFEGTMILRNFGPYLLVEMTYHPRRTATSKLNYFFFFFFFKFWVSKYQYSF